jgi:KaiC/GvpD/RAD55 family RecA-like ATPase
MSFEERAIDLAENVASLGYDLTALTADKKLVIDQVQIDRREIMETGEYDLDGLFIRLATAIDEVGARRVVLDTIETLFAALTDTQIIRSEFRRLFGWLKEKGVTAIVTGERGWNIHPPQPRGIRLRLRDRIRPAGHRSGRHASPARREVSRLRPRHQRISVPDRRAGYHRPADHRDRSI